MKRLVVPTMIALAVTMCVAYVVACGNGFVAAEDPELRVDTTTIELSTLEAKSSSEVQSSIEIENTGPGTLRINSIEWISKPDRLEAFHQGELYESNQICSSDADCGADGVCLSFSDRCADLGFRDFPIEVRSNASHTQSLILRADPDNAVTCPEPTGSDVPDNYCGELLIETNAPNDAGTGEAGQARVFIVTDGSSGELELSDTVLQFVLASPGTTQSQSFDVINEAPTPLELDRIHFTSHDSWFTITPSPNGMVIPGNSAQNFTLEMTPPETAEEDDLEFQTTVLFDSSSITGERAMTVFVTAGPGDVPLIEVEPLQLSFDQSTTQSVTVRNVGTATLSLQQMTVRPVQVEDFYGITYGGVDVIADSSALPNLGPGGEEEFVVEFTAPGDPDTSTVGELRINHNDTFADNRSLVTLLGDAAEVAVGSIAPRQINFLSDGGTQSRELMVLNSGNTALDITEVHLDAGSSTDEADYDVDGLVGVVGPGQLASATVTYTGSNEFAQSLTITTTSNHDGQSQDMVINVSASHMTDPEMDVTIDPSFPDRALVGQVTAFEVVDDAGLAQVSQATWITLDRPAGSVAVLQGSGQSATFTPDVAGQYRVAVIVRDSDGREIQESLTFEAEAE